MPLYKAFIKVFLRRLPSVISYFVVFTVIAFIMGANGSETTTFKARQLSLAVYDMDGSESSQQLVNYLAANHKLVGGIKNSDYAIQDALYNGMITAAVIIDEGFEDKLEQGDYNDLYEIMKPQNSYSSTLLEGQLSQYIKLAGVKKAGGHSTADACREASRICSEHIDVNIESSGSGSITNFGYFTQYLAYVFICILIMGVAPCLMRLDHPELRKRILCSPVRPAGRTAQMALGTFTVVAGVWTAFMAIATIIYGKEMFTRNGLLCMANSLCYIIMAAGITLLVSQFSVSDNVLSMISNVISLGMSFLCGVFVPQQYLGDGVLKAAHALPAYWYVRANNMLCGFSDEPFRSSVCMNCLGVQLGMAAVLFIAAGIVGAKKKK